jgi:alkylation response protein AidB-like acyl-CoA dehydrogenase
MSVVDASQDELREELRTAAREMLRANSTSAQVRVLAETASGFDDALWQQFALLGWPSIEVGEDFGGAGGTFGDFAVVLVEMGRQLCSNGLTATSALAAGPLLGAGPNGPSAQWLRRLAKGDVRATAVVGCDGSAHLNVVRDGDRWVASGFAPCVLDAGCSDVVILPVTDAHGAILIFAVAATTPGLAWTDAPMLDITRRFADLDVKGLEVGNTELVATGSEAELLIVDLFNRAALAIACDAFGVAEQALQMTTAYAKERVQFDRPIGSFQAVKHRCADMYIAVETARAALGEAIDTYDAAPADAAVATSRAKAYCCDAAAQVAEDAVEMHGGIGFTWEHDMHLYVKRARLDQALFGDSRWHRRRVAALTLD